MTLTTFNRYSELFRGCVAYWDGSLTSDGKLQDFVGGYHGTITTASVIGTNRFGIPNKCINLQAVGSKVSLGDSLDSVTSGASAKFTILAWVYLVTSGSSNDSKILGKTAGASISENQRQYMFCIDQSTRALNFFWYGDLAGSSFREVSSTNVISLSTWYFVGVTFDATISTINSKTSLFINGVQESVSITSSWGSPTYIPDGTAHAGIGGMLSSSGVSINDHRFQGSIGEMAIFNRVLLPEEIKARYNLTSKKYLYPVMSGNRSVE